MKNFKEIEWITPQWIEDKKTAKMLSALIPDNRIVLFNALSGNGKTSLVNSQLLDISKLYTNKQLYYFDYDGGLHRSGGAFEKLVNYHNFKASAIDSSEKHKNILTFIDEIQHPENVLVVFDGLQTVASVGNQDINNNNDMNKLMNLFKVMRTSGMTIVLIHHNNKADIRTGQSVFRGAQSIQDSVDCQLNLMGKIINPTTMKLNIIVEKFDGVPYYKGQTLNANLHIDGNLDIKDANEIVITLPKEVVLESLTQSIDKNEALPKTKLVAIVADDLSIGKNKISKAIDTLIDAGLYAIKLTGKSTKLVVKGKDLQDTYKIEKLLIANHHIKLDKLIEETGLDVENVKSILYTLDAFCYDFKGDTYTAIVKEEIKEETPMPSTEAIRKAIRKYVYISQYMKASVPLVATEVTLGFVKGGNDMFQEINNEVFGTIQTMLVDFEILLDEEETVIAPYECIPYELFSVA